MKFTRILFLLAIPFYLFSCKPLERTPNYLEKASADTIGLNTVTIPEWRIQKNDLLSIQIHSLATLPEIDELYNLPSAGSGGSATGNGATTGGYLVDLDGNLQHHRLGTIHAEGLTKQELAVEIKKRLTEPVELLKDPTVIIRLLNFRVTALGEVGKSGTVTVPGERMTILEAIGLSGDVTEFGKKNTIKVAREIDGKREIGSIDLSSVDMFKSPYFNLAQNDVIFVEPTKQKARQRDQQVVQQRVSLTLGLITAAAVIYNIFK
jgi:Periplasmic protein involved in polysaccharide export